MSRPQGSEPLAGSRVLVTGAAGFVGRHLVQRLRVAGADVRALTRAQCDLTDQRAVRAAVQAASPDVAFHLAAARGAGTAQERATSSAVNTLSGSWVVDALPGSCRAVVHLGSSTEYAASSAPMDERTPLQPRGWFGATKAAGSLLTRATAEARGIRCSVLRAFQVYGPGDHQHRLVPTVVRALQTGEPLALTAPGMRRDWVWVGDVVEACVLAATREDLPASTLFNIGTGVQTSNEELVDALRRVSGRDVATRTGEHPGRGWDTADWVADPRAAREQLGWAPTTDLESGLAVTWTTSTADRRVSAA